MRYYLLAAILALVAVAACGGDGTPDPADTRTATPIPSASVPRGPAQESRAAFGESRELAFFDGELKLWNLTVTVNDLRIDAGGLFEGIVVALEVANGSPADACRPDVVLIDPKGVTHPGAGFRAGDAGDGMPRTLFNFTSILAGTSTGEVFVYFDDLAELPVVIDGWQVGVKTTCVTPADGNFATWGA